MKSYDRFVFEKFYEKNVESERVIVSNIEHNIGVSLFPYAEEFIVQKPSGTFKGKLYMMDNGGAIRLNEDKRSINSIDYWDNFEFSDETVTNKPVYTLYLNDGDSEQSTANKAVRFVKGDFKVEEKLEGDSPDMDVSRAQNEIIQLKSLLINKTILDKHFDIFEGMEMFARQVIFGISNSLIISGMAGVGKSYTVNELLNEPGMKTKYVIFDGDISCAGLFETLFVHNKKLIVFDDIDSVWGDKDSANLLKAALDTKKEREVSRILKTSYDSEGMTYEEMLDRFNETGKLPKKFTYTGRCIFITNIDGAKIDEAIVSRSLHIDIQLSKKQVLDRLNKILAKMFTNVKQTMKEETLEFVEFILENYKCKFKLSIRTMVHAINIRIANDYNKNVEGVQMPAWQQGIKTLLIEGVEPKD